MNASTSLSSAIPARPLPPPARLPLLPFAPVSGRVALCSTLLGAALVIPGVRVLGWMPASYAELPVVEGVLAVALLKHVLIGPIIEEVVFRGLLLNLARRYLPAAVAIGLSVALFAIPHLAKNVGVTLLAAPMGCLLAAMVVRSGSLLPGIFCHVGFNLAASLSFVFLAPAGASFAAMAESFPAWTVVVSVVLAAFAGAAVFGNRAVGSRR